MTLNYDGYGDFTLRIDGRDAFAINTLSGWEMGDSDMLDEAIAAWNTRPDTPARPDREAVARLFHDTYERLAPSFGYETRTDTRAFDPTSPNGRLMIAVCGEVLALLPPADGWRSIDTAPRDKLILGAVDGETRLIRWGKTSHVPLYGFCLADQGAEVRDLCNPVAWQPLPAPPAAVGDE